MKNIFKILSFIFFIIIFGNVFVPVNTAAAAVRCNGNDESNVGGNITNVSASVNNASNIITIVWNTDSNSSSYARAWVEPLSNIPVGKLGTTVDNGNGTFSHTVIFNSTEITAGNIYSYEVHSTDGNGQTSIFCNGGNFPIFTVARVNSNLSPNPFGPGPTGGTGSTANNGTIITPVTGNNNQQQTAATPQVNIDFAIGNSSPLMSGSDTDWSILTVFKWALGLAGFAAFGAIVYAGILRLTAAANPSGIKESNEYIIGAISGIALLSVAAIIFNTINPHLTEIGEIESELDSITALPAASTSTFTNLFASSTTVLTSEENIVIGERIGIANSMWPDGRKAADNLIRAQQFGRIIIQGEGTASCRPGSDPLNNLKDIVATADDTSNPKDPNKFPIVCNNGCTSVNTDASRCVRKNIQVNPELLNATYAISASGNFGKLTITSLMGGPHMAGSKHYSGNAIDVVPPTSGFPTSCSDCAPPDAKSVWFSIVKLYQAARLEAYCEANGVVRSDGCTHVFDSNGGLKAGAHIHVET